MIKKLFILYGLCWLGTAIYEHFFENIYSRSFAYNLGKTMIWPDYWFGTEFGLAIGSVIFSLVLGYIALCRR